MGSGQKTDFAERRSSQSPSRPQWAVTVQKQTPWKETCGFPDKGMNPYVDGNKFFAQEALERKRHESRELHKLREKTLLKKQFQMIQRKQKNE